MLGSDRHGVHSNGCAAVRVIRERSSGNRSGECWCEIQRAELRLYKLSLTPLATPVLPVTRAPCLSEDMMYARCCRSEWITSARSTRREYCCCGVRKCGNNDFAAWLLVQRGGVAVRSALDLTSAGSALRFTHAPLRRCW